MGVLALAVLSVLAVASTAPISVTVDSTNHTIGAESRSLPVHVSGRVAILHADGQVTHDARKYVHQWPAIYWEAAFIGDRLILALDDDKNEYRLTIDDAPPISLAQPGQAKVTVVGLGPGIHRARLDKITESVDFSRAFKGFFVPSDGTALAAPRPRLRQIEFVGNSGMTGYGIRSSSRTCTEEEVRLRTDSGLAWPSLLAHRLDADYQINAMSGRGLVRNYDGVDPQRTMSVLYPRVLPNGAAEWHDPEWRPEVVVVLLFADFVTDLKPSEPWHDQKALVADYTRAYEKLVTVIHQRSPAATLVLPWLDFSASDDYAARQLSTAVQSAIRAKADEIGVPGVQFPVLPAFAAENTACDYHGSVNDHRRIAEWMMAWFDARPGLWRER